MAMDDTLDHGQPDAGSLQFGIAVHALEDAEQLVGVTHVEADAVVADEIPVSVRP